MVIALSQIQIVYYMRSLTRSFSSTRPMRNDTSGYMMQARMVKLTVKAKIALNNVKQQKKLDLKLLK